MPEHELCVDLHLEIESIELAAYSGSSLPYAFPITSLTISTSEHGRSQLLRSGSQRILSFLGIMSPVLQTLIALTTRIMLSLLLLRKMPFAVRNDFAHVINIVLLVLAGILFGILLQNGDDSAAAVVPNCLAAAVVFGPSCTGRFVLA